MKFITTLDEDGKEAVFMFPRSIPHDAMAEMLEGIRNQTFGDWKRVFRQPIAAGFVAPSGTCYGGSESLGLQARKQDTVLLERQMNGEPV